MIRKERVIEFNVPIQIFRFSSHFASYNKSKYYYHEIGHPTLPKWMGGEQRSTHKGNKLKGINKETYWVAELHSEKRLLSRKMALEDFLAEQLVRFKRMEKYFRHIRKTGGHIEFFVGLFCGKNMGAEVPSSLLAGMGKLGIDLSLDIYPKCLSTQQITQGDGE